jgi:hypothetical protein
VTAIALNELPAVSAKLSIPGTGAWLVDVDLDLGPSGTVPTGRAVLTIGAETLVGTIDPRASGRMGTTAHVQLVAGGGGWDKAVPAQHLHNDFGVTSTAVYSVTAAKVGEVVVDAAPVAFGPDFVRSAGPASRVFAGVAWHVDEAGITRIGMRAARAMAADVDILEWDPTTRRAILASETIIWPGTLLEDKRFGSATIRDVEQSWGTGGARITAWCETGAVGEELAGARLVRALGALARESIGSAYVRLYTYRVALMGGDGRVTLQLAGAGSVPKIVESIPLWPGVSGVTETLAEGSRVLVAFIAGDPKKPIVVAFAPDNPPSEKIVLNADRVDVGDGSTAVLRATDAFNTWVGAVTGAINGLVGPGTAVVPPDMASTKLFTE